MQSEIEKLIERLEKATGPDRELDADIFETITGSTGRVVTAPAYSPLNLQERVQVSRGVPKYSDSIDAALTLARDAEERKLMIIAMVNAFKNVDALDTFAWLKEAIIFALRALMEKV